MIFGKGFVKLNLILLSILLSYFKLSYGFELSSVSLSLTLVNLLFIILIDILSYLINIFYLSTFITYTFFRCALQRLLGQKIEELTLSKCSMFKPSMGSKDNNSTYRLSYGSSSVKKTDIFSVPSKPAVKDIIPQGLANYKLNHRPENTALTQSCFKDYDLATILDLPGYQDVFRDYSDGVKHYTYYIPKEHGSYTVVPCAMYMDSLDTLFTNEPYLLYTTHP
jgi:hypothetical protein